MPEETPIERRVRRALLLRIVALLFGLYAFFGLDRGNVGLAALQMNADLGFSSTLYGLGASVFTAAYLIFQVPAAMTMRRWGASRGFATVACGWGLVSMSSAFVWDSWSFLTIRFMLGFSEAGFGVFVVYYISQIMPHKMRGMALSMTLVAVPLTMAVASPISGFLLDWNYAGIKGWQWLFLIEGFPSVLLGLLSFRLMPDTVDHMRFLDEEERTWLKSDLAQAVTKNSHHTDIGTLLAAVRSPTVWVLGFTLFAALVGVNTLQFWMPQMIEQMSKAGNVAVGFLNAIPWLTFAIGMLVLGRVADRITNKVAVLSLAMVIAATGFAIGAISTNVGIAFVGLLVGAFGVGAVMGLFWTVPMQMLSGAGLAGAFAAINVIGNSSGLIAHGLIGWLRDHTGGFGATMLALGGILIASMIVLNFFDRLHSRHRPDSDQSKA